MFSSLKLPLSRLRQWQLNVVGESNEDKAAVKTEDHRSKVSIDLVYTLDITVHDECLIIYFLLSYVPRSICFLNESECEIIAEERRMK